MASGDSLIGADINAGTPPATNFAARGVRNGHPTALFDAAADESLDFKFPLPAHYAGGGVTLTLCWAAASANSGNCVWNAQFERLQENVAGSDLDTDGFAAVQAATGAAPGASGRLRYTDITFTDGAQMDGLLAGETFRLRVTRDANNASDTMAGDAELLTVHLKET